MLYSLVITCRNYTPDGDLERLIRENVTRLVSMTGPPVTCRVTIERTRRFRGNGNPFRVRIRLRMPEGDDISVERNPNGIRMTDPLSTSILNAFAVIHRRIVVTQGTGSLDNPRRSNMEYGAVVVRLFRDEGCGYLKTISGREIYFSRESVHNGEFYRMETGTGVWFIEKEGLKGPWASFVRIIDPLV